MANSDITTEMLLKMILDGQKKSSGAGLAIGLFVLGLVIGGVGTGAVGYATFVKPNAELAAASAPLATVSTSVPQAVAAAPQAPTTALPIQTAPVAAPTQIASSEPAGMNTRVAQSTDGAIYAYDPASGISFEMRGTDMIQIGTDAFPADVRDILLSGTPQPTGVVDPNALASQSELALAALRQQATTDERRPPINELLQSEPETVTQLRDVLDQAVGFVRPGPNASDDRPVVYAFFDPQCPYCHAAYDGIDGRFAIKWIPISVLGPNGDRLHHYMMGDTTPLNADDGPIAVVADGATDRLHDIMADDYRPSNLPLSEGHELVLSQNAEIFRLLSAGAEEMRAVPSFFIAGDDGRAVWLRGYEGQTPALMDDIIAGNAS